MARLIADNIVSPLGMTTRENVAAVLAGRSALRRYERPWGLPYPIVASLFAEGQLPQLPGLTRFERLAVVSIRQAMAGSSLDLSGEDTLFVLSTTKGNIELLRTDGAQPEDEYPAEAALRIARTVGISTEPIVVCNACTSGLSALIVANRLLREGKYRKAVVCGADCQGPFIVSGFHSLNALSPYPCRPFDSERTGLNLGEAAATMVLLADGEGEWELSRGFLRNDAYHISAPARDGSGLRLTIEAALRQQDGQTADSICAHGTATMFNDQMEAMAIAGAGLGETPVHSLKPYFGHTMGAAGILESIVALHAAKQGVVPATPGFNEPGVSRHIAVSGKQQSARGRSVLKLLSGFGGCNASSLWTRGGKGLPGQEPEGMNFVKLHNVKISPEAAYVDSEKLETEARGAELLTELYKKHVGDYPKYYKMDGLSRLGFIASELLAKPEEKPGHGLTGVAFCCHSSSLVSDVAFQETIANAASYFPSPAHFVYTLPNIVTGEIAIRNNYHGETNFYLLRKKDTSRIDRLVASAFADEDIGMMVGGWIDYQSDSRFEADICIYKRQWKNS